MPLLYHFLATRSQSNTPAGRRRVLCLFCFFEGEPSCELLAHKRAPIALRREVPCQTLEFGTLIWPVDTHRPNVHRINGPPERATQGVHTRASPKAKQYIAIRNVTLHWQVPEPRQARQRPACTCEPLIRKQQLSVFSTDDQPLAPRTWFPAKPPEPRPEPSLPSPSSLLSSPLEWFPADPCPEPHLSLRPSHFLSQPKEFAPQTCITV